MTYIDPLHEPEEPTYYGVPLDDHEGGVPPVWIGILVVLVLVVVAWKVWRT